MERIADYCGVEQVPSCWHAARLVKYTGPLVKVKKSVCLLELAVTDRPSAAGPVGNCTCQASTLFVA